MKFILLFILLINYSYANYKILNFNTMCDLCKGSSLPLFQLRVKTFRIIIEKYKPDLLSLQEIRTNDQVKKILYPNQNYQIITNTKDFFSSADPAIAFNKKKFLLIEQGHFWLGPNSESINLGWKYALPRQVLWVKLKDLQTQKVFIFISTHLDNRIENIEGSADLLGSFFKKFNLPILFAADTNITVDMSAYQTLLANKMHNAFDSLPFKIKKKNTKDYCYTRKGDQFPDCRVDHVLYAPKEAWTIQKFQIDLTKIKNKDQFPSDHRPVIVTIDLKN